MVEFVMALSKKLRKLGKLRKKLLASAGALGLATLALAGAAPAEDEAKAATVPAQVEKALRGKFANPALGLEVDSVAVSELPGMYRVQLRQGPILYATGDGAHFILGDLYGVAATGFVNLTERQRSENRRLALADVAGAKTIVFPAEGRIRAHVTVFTDVSCFYCQKFHREVPELNRRGVEVRYLAYPREGIGSAGFRQLASAWCADDRPSTLTRLKNGETLPANVCTGNPIAEQFELGQQLGVRGTPAIVTPLGEMIPGYRSADDLMALLGVE